MDKAIRRTLTLSGAIKPTVQRRRQLGDPIALAARRSEIKTHAKVALQILSAAARREARS